MIRWWVWELVQVHLADMNNIKWSYQTQRNMLFFLSKTKIQATSGSLSAVRIFPTWEYSESRRFQVDWWWWLKVEDAVSCRAAILPQLMSQLSTIDVTTLNMFQQFHANFVKVKKLGMHHIDTFNISKKNSNSFCLKFCPAGNHEGIEVNFSLLLANFGSSICFLARFGYVMMVDRLFD